MNKTISAGVVLAFTILIAILCSKNNIEVEESQGMSVEAEEVEEVEEVIPAEIKEFVVTEVSTEEVFTPLDIPLDAEVQEYLKNKCHEKHIDFAFMLALIDVESNFKADEISVTNDHGLLQINECNHEELALATGVTDFLNPYDNIDAGLYMLLNLFEKYEDVELVLMAYHFGESGANNLWEQGIYTSEYSQVILEKQLEFQKMIDDEEQKNE